MTGTGSRTGILVLFLLFAGVCSASDLPDDQTATPLQVVKCPENAIRIDGFLSEEAWESALKLKLNWEIYPEQNTATDIRTECYICYDSQNLYVGFKAWDSNPEAIRAHLSDRDKISADDQVGFYIDTFNDEHRGYSFFANPLGIQADSIRDDLSRGEDTSWDAIWDCRGRMTENGYEVEFAIPFNQFRFQQVDGEQVWGFSGQRNLPRNEKRRLATQKIELYNQEYFKQFTKISGFKNISASKHIQITPTLTSFQTRYRPNFPLGDFVEGNSENHIGLTGSWGVSPNITLSGTINPDFSQIEADAAQLDVNLSYALVYPEKRPFFLEGINKFQTLLGIVHTRAIADPEWGLKLIGQEGVNSFGFLATRDSQTNLILPGNQGSRMLSLPIESNSTIVRYQREIGGNSGIGFIATDRRGNNYQNSVFGVDGTFNITRSDSLKIQILRSETDYPDYYSQAWNQPLDSFDGGAFKLNYNHFTRGLQYYLYYNGIGNSFRAETGYVPQVNRNYINTGVGYTFWFDKSSPLVNAQAFAAFQHSEVSNGKVLYNAFKSWFSLNGPMLSNLYYSYYKYLHHYHGIDFHILTHDLRFNISPTGNSYFSVSVDKGDRIDYLHERLGERLKISPKAILKFGQNLSISFAHDYEHFSIAGERLYLANLSQIAAVYNFDSRSFIRLVTQYNDIKKNQNLYLLPVESKSRKLFNQILYSYKVNPQTVIYIGYSDNYLNDYHYTLVQKDNTFFCKFSYAWLN